MWTFNSRAITSCALDQVYVYLGERADEVCLALCNSNVLIQFLPFVLICSLTCCIYIYVQIYIEEWHHLWHVLWMLCCRKCCVPPWMAYFLTLSLKATTLLCLCRSASETPDINSVKRPFTESLRWTMASGGSCLTCRTYEWKQGWLNGWLDKDFVEIVSKTNLGSHLINRLHKTIDFSVQSGTLQNHVLQFL